MYQSHHRLHVSQYGPVTKRQAPGQVERFASCAHWWFGRLHSRADGHSRTGVVDEVVPDVRRPRATLLAAFLFYFFRKFLLSPHNSPFGVKEKKSKIRINIMC